MGDALPKVHGPGGGSHACLFCGQRYECFVLHLVAGEPMQEKWRCCTNCRLTNMGDARKLRMGGED